MKRILAILLFVPTIASALSIQFYVLGFGSICSYPGAAVRERIEGVSQLRYRVTADGKIADITIAKSSGNIDLDRAATSCVAGWKGAAPPRDQWGSIHHGSIRWMMHYSTHSSPTPYPAGYFLEQPHNCDGWFPPAALKAKAKGTTILQFAISPGGDVKSPRVIRSSGNTELDHAALRCVATWPYPPAGTKTQPSESAHEAAVEWRTD